MKNICFIIDSLSGGGAERVVLSLSQALIELEHLVHIVILENKISYDISSSHFRLHILTENRKLSSNKFWNKVLLSRKLKRKIRDLESQYGEFDLIVSNLEDSDKTSSMAKLHNLYHCYHVSMQQFLANKVDHKKYYKHIYRKFKENTRHKYLYRNSNMIAVSKGVMQDIIDFGVNPKSIINIYNPFDIEEIRAKSLENNSEIPSEKYIINIARFAKHKRHDILIKAYANANVNHKLILMGTTDKPGDEENLIKIKDLIIKLGLENQVIFTGFVANPYSWLKNADLFVLSSDIEGLANVLVESLILNTMVVSTNCPFGPSEILTGELKSFLSPIRDVEALSNNIVRAINNPVHITDDYIAKFNAKKIAKKYLSLAK
jgi:glycosyltransferase involved in cell wall biosynthesis